MPVDPAVRRAALIATVVTVPLVLIIALLLGGGSGSNSPTAAPSSGVLPPVSASAPPDTSAATVSTCAKVISALPLQLTGLDLRRTVSNPPSSSIVAWGDPPVVLRCGVSRPKSLVPGSSAQYISTTGQGGPFYDVTTGSAANVYTSVDRAVYIKITVPAQYHSSPLPPISRAIARVLKAVCVAGQPGAGPLPARQTLCDHRK